MKRNALIILIMLIFAGLTASTASGQDIRIVGADTLILLGQRWSQGFHLKQPNISIQVQGGGAANGLKTLAAGRAQIVQSEKNLPGAQEIRIPIGIQGIAVYVNRSNPINELTLAQLRAIYVGEITNWKELGGPNQRILLYAGDSNTDTDAYFQEAVLRNAEPYPYVGLNSAKELVDQISNHAEAIGYSSVYPNNRTKVLRIKAAEIGSAVEATIETIRQRQYPISRYIYWYLSSKPTGKVKAFCEWALSNEGQLVVESVGFEPLPQADRVADLRKLDVNVVAATH